jgi:hypothetical protein
MGVGDDVAVDVINEPRAHTLGARELHGRGKNTGR